MSRVSMMPRDALNDSDFSKAMTKDLTRLLYESAGRHFVTLSCVQHLPNDGGSKALIFSGFLVEVENLWLYVTAGHILDDVKTALASGSEFDRWRLDDSTAGNPFHGFAVPLDFVIDDWLVIRDSELGIDYAALPLLNLYRQLLAAGGAQALGPDTWGTYLDEHLAWALIGIPSESVNFDGVTRLTARVVTVPLEASATPPEAGSKAENQFYATFVASPDGFIQDMDGMSGGPVFSLHERDADSWIYRVIGVQSAWYKSQKVLAICPFDSFGEAIAEVINEARRLSEHQISGPQSSPEDKCP